MAENSDLLQEVREGDYDRFLAIQLAPPAVRPALYVVTAFALELARIAETVSEPMLGQIRLAWWREALEEIINGAKPRNHPVVLGLAELYQQTPALFTPLLAMVEARAADLDESLLASEDGWHAYLDGTAGALHRAWALLLDAEAAAAYAEPIGRQARAYAKIGLVRAIPYLSAQGFMRFPQSLLDRYDVNTLAPSERLPAFARAMVEDTALGTYRLPKKLLPLNGLARLAKLSGKALDRSGFDPYKTVRGKLGPVIAVLQIKYF